MKELTTVYCSAHKPRQRSAARCSGDHAGDTRRLAPVASEREHTYRDVDRTVDGNRDGRKRYSSRKIVHQLSLFYYCCRGQVCHHTYGIPNMPHYA